MEELFKAQATLPTGETITFAQSERGGSVRVEVDRPEDILHVSRHQLFRPNVAKTVMTTLHKFGVDTTYPEVSDLLNSLDEFSAEQRRVYYPPGFYDGEDDDAELPPPAYLVPPSPESYMVNGLKAAYDICINLVNTDVVLHTALLDAAQESATRLRFIINHLRANEFFGDTDKVDADG